MINNQLTEKRARLRKAAQDYQSSLSWYQENLDSPNAEQDCDESSAAFKREIGYREMDIIADLLDEIDELQEPRKPLQDKDLQGVIDALEHPAGINAAGKQVVRHALVEIQERRKADREPVAEVVSIYGDPEAFGEREIRPLVGIQQMPYGTKLYRHAQPVPVVSADLLHTAASAIEDLLEHTDPNTSYYSGVWADVPGKLRAAMFQAKSLTGNSPVIGIDLASGPDRTVEVHYVAPPGYVMVPKEPTEAMMLHNSGCQHHAWDDPDCAMRQTRRLIWSHMLAAAPQEVK
ncbi:hypothetical protein NUKP42_47870 [Klebsiella variicola]|nr:hypothetical protein NUKP42_47870 [Klebsiella variicola]